ncbi:DUF6332 family protein [Streptomyces sp. NPDC059443]|uniref:DUF6332 family protein n=1 Tax=unclassified Streptomyces TaxID=2593676 RepID=UPI0036CD5CC1
MGRRSQADRDAITIEIAYAFISGSFAAALTFAAVYGGPALAFDLSPTTARILAMVGGTLAGTVFLVRVTHLLWRFSRPPENDDRK